MQSFDDYLDGDCTGGPYPWIGGYDCTPNGCIWVDGSNWDFVGPRYSHDNEYLHLNANNGRWGTWGSIGIAKGICEYIAPGNTLPA